MGVATTVGVAGEGAATACMTKRKLIISQSMTTSFLSLPQAYIYIYTHMCIPQVHVHIHVCMKSEKQSGVSYKHHNIIHIHVHVQAIREK